MCISCINHFCLFTIQIGELNEFESGQIIGLWTIGRILKIPETNITDTITQHGSSNSGTSAKRTGRSRSINDDRHKLKQEEWEKLTHETYINLIKSMSNRIETCI